MQTANLRIVALAAFLAAVLTVAPFTLASPAQAHGADQHNAGSHDGRAIGTKSANDHGSKDPGLPTYVDGYEPTRAQSKSPSCAGSFIVTVACSYLYSGNGYPDSVLRVCDHQKDGSNARARAWDSQANNYRYAITDGYGDCSTTYTYRNNEYHETGTFGLYEDRSYHR